MSIARGKRDDTAALLAERFPRCFAIYEARRRPLKIGIHADITAPLGGAITWRELRNALCSYILDRGYIALAPSASISMATSRASRPPTRLTMPERSSCAAQRRRLPGRRPRRCRHLSSPTSPPKRLGLADLKLTARRRKQPTASAVDIIAKSEDRR